MLNDKKYHFYVSRVPCGDAVIREKSTNVNSSKPSKIPKLQDDIYRTGAKVLPGRDKSDTLEPGENYHTKGLFRLKPGRSDCTNISHPQIG